MVVKYRTLSTHLVCFSCKLDFFLTDGGPELNSLESDPLIGVFHPYNSKLENYKPLVSCKTVRCTYSEQRLLHIKSHFFVVEGHDPHQTLKCTNLNGHRWILSGFTDDLHNIVSFTLIRPIGWIQLDYDRVEKMNLPRAQSFL